MTGFIEKNNDLLFRDLSQAMWAARHALLRSLFPEGDPQKVSLKLPPTAGFQFKSSVALLMKNLYSKNPNYIRYGPGRDPRGEEGRLWLLRDPTPNHRCPLQVHQTQRHQGSDGVHAGAGAVTGPVPGADGERAGAAGGLRLPPALQPLPGALQDAQPPHLAPLGRWGQVWWGLARIVRVRGLPRGALTALISAVVQGGR